MKSLSHIKKNWMVHGLLWLVLTIVGWWHSQFVIGTTGIITPVRVLGTLILFLGIFYLNYFWGMPRLVENGKWLFYVILIITLFLSGLWGQELIDRFLDLKIQFERGSIWEFYLLGGPLLVLSTSVGLRIADTWDQRQELKEELAFHQMEAELNSLKAQLNPHFLLNTLNNIYTLIETKSPLAGSTIMRLSEMMRYMLYESKNETVPLANEIKYIRNFIALQQLKKDGEMDITFVVEGDPNTLTIPPMLLFPFFENAFKHGSPDMPDKGWLKGKLILNQTELSFSLENTIDPEKRKPEMQGIKIANIRKRLEILYPDRHSLDIEATDHRYLVELSIDLS